MIKRDKDNIKKNITLSFPLTGLFLSIIIFTLCLVNVQYVLAQVVPNIGSGDNPPTVIPAETNTPSNPPSLLQNPIKAKSVTEVLNLAVDLAIFIGVIIAVLMFIFIGFKFVLAQGNEAKLKSAKEWFLWAVIGTAILISAKVIVKVIEATLISSGVVSDDSPLRKK